MDETYRHTDAAGPAFDTGVQKNVSERWTARRRSSPRGHAPLE